MRAELDLKRDIFRKTIRREHINKILTQRRKQLIGPGSVTASTVQSILSQICQTYKQPFVISRHIAILNELSLLAGIAIADPQILKYLEKLTEKKVRDEIMSEQWEEVFELIATLMGKYIQNEQQSVIANQHLIWATVENLGGCWLWGKLSEYEDENVKKIAFRMFHRFVEGLDKARIAHDEIGWIYSNFITKQPKAPFTSACCVIDTFLKAWELMIDDDFYDYACSLLEISRQQHQIQLMNDLEVLPAFLQFVKKTKDSNCICITLKFISMMFKGSDSLSLKVYLNNNNVVKTIYDQLDTGSEGISAWALFALANFCANGQQFIKTIFQTDIIPKSVKLYSNGSNKLRQQVVFLFYVICDKGGDKFRMRLYEQNALNVIMNELSNDCSTTTLEVCLKVVYCMLLSASKMDSLQMTYTLVIKRQLLNNGFKRKLQELVDHPKDSISNQAQLILNTYLQGPLLF